MLTLSKTGGDATLTEVQRGGADLAQQGAIPPSRFEQVRTRYAAQFYVTPRAGVIMFALNIHRPPFDNELARRAVAFALDRARLLRGFGGSELASTTCQVLPPSFPGYDRYCPFTLGPTEDGAWTAPDLEAAHKLVAESGTDGHAGRDPRHPGEIRRRRFCGVDDRPARHTRRARLPHIRFVRQRARRVLHPQAPGRGRLDRVVPGLLDTCGLPHASAL